MATYEAILYLDAFQSMEDQRKTVYAVIAGPDYADMTAGDRLEFGDYGSITIGMVRRYPTLDALVAAEGWQCLVPDAESAEDAVEQVRSIAEWTHEGEQAHGVLSLRVREARRKTS